MDRHSFESCHKAFTPAVDCLPYGLTRCEKAAHPPSLACRRLVRQALARCIRHSFLQPVLCLTTVQQNGLPCFSKTDKFPRKTSMLQAGGDRSWCCWRRRLPACPEACGSGFGRSVQKLLAQDSGTPAGTPRYLPRREAR